MARARRGSAYHEPMARLVFHLVHGTQFYLLARPRVRWLMCGKPEVPWIRDGSPLRKGLRTSLESQGHVVEFRPVEWSGRNRHAARVEAARRIRESLAEGPADARHFLIAHSHGGNACLLALKEDEAQPPAAERLADQLTGIACLSTPFLVVQKADWAVAATVAWISALALGIANFAIWRFDRFFGVGLGVLTLVAFMLPVMVLLRRFKDLGEWVQAPAEPHVPVLILRSPGDEASSGLGFVAGSLRPSHGPLHLGRDHTPWPMGELAARSPRLRGATAGPRRLQPRGGP